MIESWVETLQPRTVEVTKTPIEGVFSMQIDDEYPVTYLGQANPGSATSAAAWRIMKIDETSTPDVSITFAGGGAFDQVWDNRISLSYS